MIFNLRERHRERQTDRQSFGQRKLPDIFHKREIIFRDGFIVPYILFFPTTPFPSKRKPIDRYLVHTLLVFCVKFTDHKRLNCAVLETKIYATF